MKMEKFPKYWREQVCFGRLWQYGISRPEGINGILFRTSREMDFVGFRLCGSNTGS